MLSRRMNPRVYRAALGVLTMGLLNGAQLWRVRVEEPTGIERRVDEVVSLPVARFGGRVQGFRVTDPQSREVPWQVTAGRLLFPVSLMPGTTPEYTVACCQTQVGAFPNRIVARRVGMNRIEMANPHFRVVIDLRRAALVEAYNLSAPAPQALNLVDMTPERPDPNDIHGDEKRPEGPPTPVSGENDGWTALGKGPIDEAEILDQGPVYAHVRLRRGADRWDFEFTAESRWLRWRAPRGFRFASVSALPYLPFDRCADVSEYRWPTGPGAGEPPASQVLARPWAQPPDGHFVYYRQAENYGALGIVALNASLRFSGACSRKFEVREEGGEAGIALTFPVWRGNATLLEARREARMIRQPVMVEVSDAGEGPLPIAAVPMARQALPQLEMVAAAPAEWKPPIIDLSGEWELAWGEKGAPPSSEWRKVQVPGTAHVQWLPPEQLYRPEAAWVSRKVWWYRRQVTVPEDWAGRALRLQLEATDYYAEVFLDGVRVGRHEGYIDPWEIDLTGKLRPEAGHELLVRVWTPVHYYWKHRSYTIKGAYGAVDQKPDDITAVGITRAVRLVAGGDARIRDAAVATHLTGPNSADVEVSLEAEGDLSSLIWELTLAPRNFQGGAALRIRRAANSPREKLTIPVAGARLWHTWDTGFPHLYTLDARLVQPTGEIVDARRMAVGIREIERVEDHFYLNRRRLFIRGTNAYFHLFLSEMDRKAYERDFAIIRDMNVNAVRLHCHFDNPEIYDLADEQGILIWQDFLEAWYPRDTEFSRHAAALFDNHIRYARNHPSLMAWAPSDEEDHVNYNDLSKHLAARAALLDPQQRYVQRSTGRYGDAHLYYGWYGGSIWEYARMTEPLVTELGAPSLPSRQSLDRFLGGKWPMLSFAGEWRFHRLQIEEAIANIGDPNLLSLDEFIRRSQDYTARLFQVALERARRNKASGAAGIFHFFAIDIWPSVTMAAVDFYRAPMKVHGTVKRSFAPVLSSVEYTQDRWKSGETLDLPVWAVNDFWREIPGAVVRWRLADARGAERLTGEVSLDLPADSSQRVGTVRWKAESAGEFVLRTEVWGAGKELSHNEFEFRIEP